MRSIVTVTDAAESKNLTVLETVKGELDITGSEQDARLSDLICAASDIVAAYCKRQFAEEGVTETFLPEHRLSCEYADSLVLDRFPVTSIVSVTDNNSVLAATDFTLDAEKGILYRTSSGSYFPWNVWGWGSIVVDYVGGYALLDDLPRSIERATILLVKDMYSAQGRDPRIRSESVPGVMSIDYWVGAVGPAGELPPDVTALLAPFRRLIA